MARLVQVRECDRQCCRENPQYPIRGPRRDCRFNTERGCQVMLGEVSIPKEGDFVNNCSLWPQNTEEGYDTGGCCWQWIEDGAT